MKKSNILAAVFAVMSAASAAMAEGPQINFDGRTAGAMSFKEAINAMEVPQNISPAPATLMSKSDILVVQQDEFYKLNSGDRKKLQEAAKVAVNDNAVVELINNKELFVLFSRYAVIFKDLSGNLKPLSEKQNRQTLNLVRGTVGKSVDNLPTRFDMDNSTWMQPVCVKWGTEETTILKKICKVVNAYVNGGWVGTLVCEMIPTTVTVRVCLEYKSGI